MTYNVFCGTLNPTLLLLIVLVVVVYFLSKSQEKSKETDHTVYAILPDCINYF